MAGGFLFERALCAKGQRDCSCTIPRDPTRSMQEILGQKVISVSRYYVQCWIPRVLCEARGRSHPVSQGLKMFYKVGSKDTVQR